jgi:hypothetical protein
MFAIDGVKLPSNASKARSGTRADFQRQLGKMEKQALRMIEAQRQADAQPLDEAQRHSRKLERLQRETEQLRQWLNEHPKDRLGVKGDPIMSNLTDNESAKMATDKGVIQGYTGVATVDDKHQIIVDAQAFGTGRHRVRQVELHRAHEAGDRLGTWQTGLRRTLRHGGAGVCQHPAQQGPQSFYATRAEEGGYAVEALLSGA